MKDVLILGIGNIARMDDGIGVHLVDYIVNSDVDLPGNVDIIEGGAAVYDFLPVMMRKKKIVLVDALMTNDTPGSIYRFPVRHLKNGPSDFFFPCSNLRDILFQAYLACGEADVEIIGIVPEDVDTCKIGLSDSVKSVIPFAVCEIIKAVNNCN